MSSRNVAPAIALATMAISLAGCSRAVGSYLLAHQGNAEILVPPGIMLPEEAPSS